MYNVYMHWWEFACFLGLKHLMIIRLHLLLVCVCVCVCVCERERENLPNVALRSAYNRFSTVYKNKMVALHFTSDTHVGVC